MRCPTCEEKREQERRKEERKRYVAQRIERTFPPKFRDVSFTSYCTDLEELHKRGRTYYEEQDVIQMERMKSYVRDWAKTAHEKATSMLFLGAPGTGKDHLASACLLHQIRKHLTVCKMISAQQLFMEIKEFYSGRKSDMKYMNDVAQVPILVLNEVGVQLKTAWELERLNWLINERVNHLKPMILISNEDLQTFKETIGDRAFDRILEAGNLLCQFTWPSYRQGGI